MQYWKVNTSLAKNFTDLVEWIDATVYQPRSCQEIISAWCEPQIIFVVFLIIRIIDDVEGFSEWRRWRTITAGNYGAIAAETDIVAGMRRATSFRRRTRGHSSWWFHLTDAECHNSNFVNWSHWTNIQLTGD